MIANDVNALKGRLKNALVDWSGSLIDQVLPNRVTARTLAKNALGNAIARFDGNVNQMVDTVFLIFGDESGSIDTDSTIDLLCDMLDEMPKKDYDLGMIKANVGNGEIVIKLPDSIFSDLIVGDLGGVKITCEDIKGLKNYLS